MPTRLTLIDTGVGPTDSAFGRWLGVGGTLPAGLAALGVMSDDDDDVILTPRPLGPQSVEHDAVVERMGPAVLECPTTSMTTPELLGLPRREAVATEAPG